MRHGNTGVNPDLGTLDSPIKCLYALLTDDIIDNLIHCINDCRLFMPKEQSTSTLLCLLISNLLNVTRDEFLHFLAILLVVGLNPRDSIRSFYSRKPRLDTPWYKNMMTGKRFKSLYHTFFHAGGVQAETKEKMEPFLEALCQSFQHAYYPSKEIAIDEMVIGFKGHWKNKQFNASKPSKYHIKTFGLCQSESGYVCNPFTYYASETSYHPNLDPNVATLSRRLRNY